jgi:hypothetical protein
MTTSTNPDQAAEDFTTALADILDCDGNEVIRFTPSMKLGRRYLAIIRDGIIYKIEVNVSDTATP